MEIMLSLFKLFLCWLGGSEQGNTINFNTFSVLIKTNTIFLIESLP